MDNIDHYRSTINKSTNQQTAAVWGLCPGRGDSQQATQAHVPWSVDLLWRWLRDVPRTEVSTWWTEMYIIIIIVNTWNLEKNVCCMSLGPNVAASNSTWKSACSHTRVSQVCALYAVALSLGDAQTSSHVWEVRWPCAHARLCMSSQFLNWKIPISNYFSPWNKRSLIWISFFSCSFHVHFPFSHISGKFCKMSSVVLVELILIVSPRGGVNNMMSSKQGPLQLWHNQHQQPVGYPLSGNRASKLISKAWRTSSSVWRQPFNHFGWRCFGDIRRTVARWLQPGL